MYPRAPSSPSPREVESPNGHPVEAVHEFCRPGCGTPVGEIVGGRRGWFPQGVLRRLDISPRYLRLRSARPCAPCARLSSRPRDGPQDPPVGRPASLLERSDHGCPAASSAPGWLPLQRPHLIAALGHPRAESRSLSLHSPLSRFTTAAFSGQIGAWSLGSSGRPASEQ